MNESPGFAVFFFPQALDALGEAIKPYLQDGPAGLHVPCREVDTGGAFIEMTLEGRTADGREVALELMVPGNMVRMIVSARSDGDFGFYDRRSRRAPCWNPVWRRRRREIRRWLPPMKAGRSPDQACSRAQPRPLKPSSGWKRRL